MTSEYVLQKVRGCKYYQGGGLCLNKAEGSVSIQGKLCFAVVGCCINAEICFDRNNQKEVK